MSKYLRKFETQATYQAAQPSLERPNVSLIEEGRVIGYNPLAPTPVVETRIVAKYDVSDTSEATDLFYNYSDEPLNYISSMEIDGIEQAEVVPSYKFDTTGIHTVKYALKTYEPHGLDLFENINTLISVYIPEGITEISGYFVYCSALTSVTLPSTSIQLNNTFYGCSALPSITIPDSVTGIGYSTFYGCCALSSITIPNSVTSIGHNAFSGCTALSSITVMATTPPTLGEEVFEDTNDCPIYVPAASVDTYKAAEGWSEYASRIQAIP